MDNNMNEKDNEVVKTAEQGAAHTEHHHTERHHHHHHHSSRRRSKKRKKKKVNAKIALIVSILLLTILAVIVVLAETGHLHKSSSEQEQKEEAYSDILTVEVVNPEGVLVMSAVNQYLSTDLLNSFNADVLLSDFSDGGARLDEQVPVGLKLSTKDGAAALYKIELANNDSFDNAEIFYVDATAVTYEFKHLYANTQYYYRVTAYTIESVSMQMGSFKTADTPRILTISGLSNVRDIGNWRTDSGKRIKQGLLIRGTEMDGAIESGYHLTNDGLKDMLDVYGIKTEMDLRTQTPTSKDALGSRVAHRYYGIVAYENIFTAMGKERIRNVFADFANPDNYPVYLHCTYGMDRTGTVCFLLEALLGVSRGDCYKDYGLSNLKISNIQVVENGLKAYDGTTLKEQAESYLLSCGVSEYQIESIRNIFLGD